MPCGCVGACVKPRRQIRRLGTECALTGAVAEAQHAQAIRWPLEGGAETATAGIGRLLGAEAGPDGWLALLRSMLRDDDGRALDESVAKLRRQARRSRPRYAPATARAC